MTTAKRQLAWFEHISRGGTVASGGQGQVLLSNNMDAADKRGCTVTRMIGTVTLRPVLVNLQQFVYLGICMIHEDQVDFPDPSIELDQPGWLWKGSATVGTTNVGDYSQWARIPIDARSQRKFRGPSDVLRLVMDNVAGGGTSVDLDVNLRILCRMG